MAVHMAIDGVGLKVEGESAVQTLREARDILGRGNGELVVDFSVLQRIEPGLIEELEKLADQAEGKVVVVLRGVKVDAYKVLKLTKLASRFSFLN